MINFLRQNALTLIGILISVLSIWYLTGEYDVSSVLSLIYKADPLWLFGACALIVLSFLLRAYRWKILLIDSKYVGFRQCYKSLMLGYFLNNILPARAGDIARVVDMSRSLVISKTKVFTTLVGEKLIDLFVTIVLMLGAILFYPDLPSWMKESSYYAGVVVVFLMTFLFFIYKYTDRLEAVLQKDFVAGFSVRAQSFFIRVLGSASEGLHGLFNPLSVFGYSVLTFVIWLIEVGIFVVVAYSLGLDLAFGNALFILLVIAIGSMVPSSPGFIGTYELFGVSAASFVGINGDVAFAFILLVHVMLIALTSLMGMSVMIGKGILKKKGPGIGSEANE